MNISAINAAHSQYTTQPVSWTRKSSSSSTTDSSSDGLSISGPGQFFSQLQQLSAQNPADFKQVIAEMAQKLDTEAQQAGNSTDAQRLQSMAGRFEQASQTGDFSSLLPSNSDGSSSTAQAQGTQRAHSGHHHGHHAGGVSDLTSTDSTDPLSDPLSSLFSQMGPQVQNALDPSSALSL
ncbi:MAG: hypothetical protein ACREIC_25365 [Limisphaerales bacterium]